MNMIQSAKDQVLALTTAAYQKASAAGLLPEGVTGPTEDHRCVLWGSVRCRFTYLDTSREGRPVFEFTQHNVVDEQKGEMITVSYELSGWRVMKKPLVCVGAFFALFAVKAVVNALRKVKRDCVVCCVMHIHDND